MGKTHRLPKEKMEGEYKGQKSGSASGSMGEFFLDELIILENLVNNT